MMILRNISIKILLVTILTVLITGCSTSPKQQITESKVQGFFEQVPYQEFIGGLLTLFALGADDNYGYYEFEDEDAEQTPGNEWYSDMMQRSKQGVIGRTGDAVLSDSTGFAHDYLEGKSSVEKRDLERARKILDQ